jgi:hypothetical protein
MPSSAPKSIATLEDSRSGETAHIVDALVDRHTEKLRSIGALTPVCFTALAASAAVNDEGPTLTFATHTGKSLQVLLRLPPEKAREFRHDLAALLTRILRIHQDASPTFPS